MKDIEITQVTTVTFGEYRRVTTAKTAAKYYAEEMLERDPAIDKQYEEFVALEDDAWRILDETNHNIHYGRCARYRIRAIRRLLPIFKGLLK